MGEDFFLNLKIGIAYCIFPQTLSFLLPEKNMVTLSWQNWKSTIIILVFQYTLLVLCFSINIYP